VKSEQVALDESAGRLPVGAEEYRDAGVDDDGKNSSENGVGVRTGAVTPAEDVAEVGLNDDARGRIPGKALEFPLEPFPGTDDGGDEVLEGLALHRHGILMPLDGVILRRRGRGRRSLYSQTRKRSRLDIE